MPGLFCNLATASTGRSGWFGGSESFKERGGRFVVGVLGDEFAAEGGGKSE
jgi:hypothetical protein